MKILNYGSINIDLVYPVDHIVKPGETIHGGKLERFAGGKGANQSVALAKAGSNIWHAGKIGKDGRWLLEKLEKYGVNIDLVTIGDCDTGHALIQVSNAGENSIILYGGGNQQNSIDEINKILDHFEKGDYLILQNEINHNEEIITKANKIGMIICLNPAPFCNDIKEWPLDKVDILVLNEHEAAGLAGLEISNSNFEAILKEITSLYPEKEIIMTVGKAGAYYGKNSIVFHQPIIDSNVVDTTAAGDTFLGYYIASKIAGLSIEDSLARATKASSITVSKKGAMDSIPYAKELDIK